jgi:hypothetical protein
MSRLVNATFINGRDGWSFLCPGKRRPCHRAPLDVSRIEIAELRNESKAAPVVVDHRQLHRAPVAERRVCAPAFHKDWEHFMCEKCVQLDEKIVHYKALSMQITDQPTLDGIAILIGQYEAQKRELHPSKE